jgi:hypothetical protein
MKRFFYPGVGATVRRAGTMQKGKITDVSRFEGIGIHFYVNFGKDHFGWLSMDEIGCELHDRLEVFRPLVDEEQDFTEWIVERPMWMRKLAAALIVVGGVAVVGIIVLVIVPW